MRPAYWIYIFLAVTVVYFTGMALHQDTIQFCCKPLLVSTLLGYFIASTSGQKPAYKKWVIAALLFSIAGDTFLRFAGSNNLVFILGLVAFLVAHIGYIACFCSIKKSAGIPGKWYPAIAVGLYYFLMMHLLLPQLGALQLPVLVYGLAISLMLLTAAWLFPMANRQAAQYFLTGAVLFVLSDSVLAIDKFYRPQPWAGWIIMSTYVLAQWLLTRGFISQVAWVLKRHELR